ncbi:MAG TPA: FxsA family protein [Pseudomonadales bacterium]
MWFLVFFATPIVEMYLLIKVGGYIGAWPTIGLVMLTAVIGIGLLRIQGLATLTRGLGRLEGGELPALEVVEGLLLAAAGALLLTPGFVTDGIGFALLTPGIRRRVAERLLSRLEVRPAGPHGGPRSGSASPGTLLEGEFERVDDQDGDRARR